jgi:hypothetical protein
VFHLRFVHLIVSAPMKTISECLLIVLLSANVIICINNKFENNGLAVDDLMSKECHLVIGIWAKMGGSQSNSVHGLNCCQMRGVSCYQNKVTGISWIGEHLSGSIPSEIGQLVHLSYL